MSEQTPPFWLENKRRWQEEYESSRLSWRLHVRGMAAMRPGFYWLRDYFSQSAVVRCDELDRGVPGLLWPTSTEIAAESKYVIAGEMAFRPTERGWLYQEERRKTSGICKPGYQRLDCYKILE